MQDPGPKDVLGELRELAEAESAASSALRAANHALRAAIVAILAKPYQERGVTTTQIAEAIGRSRQQLHQMNRDARR